MKEQRYVLVMGQVCRWEDKAPFVLSGKSVLGAIEYDRDTDKLKCHECGDWHGSLASHITKAHDLRAVGYKLQHGLRRKTALVSLDITRKLKETRAKQGNTACFLNRPKQPKSIRTPNQHRDMELRNLHGTCPVQVPARIKQLAIQLGRTPTAREIVSAGISIASSGKTVRVLQELAGLEANVSTQDRAYSKAVLVEILRDFYVLNKRVPYQREMRLPMMPDQKVFRRNFGTMLQALEAAGLGLQARKRGSNQTCLVVAGKKAA